MLMQRAERRAGLEALGHIHVLRHTFCSHLAMAGASPLSVQNLAGHKSLETTMRYMHLSPNAADEAIAKMVQGREGAARANVARVGSGDRDEG
jgi:site-specific recombinase XerD